MAARRGRKISKRRRGPKVTSLLGLAEGYIQMDILTKNLLGGSNPVSFLFGDWSGGYGSGAGTSLQEIISNPQASLETIGTNLMDPKTVMTVAGQSFLANAGFKFARKALRRPVNTINRLAFKPLGIGVKL